MTRHKRINGLQEALSQRGLTGAVLFYSRDVLYYTGTAQPSYLAVSADDYHLYVRSGYECAREDVFINPDHVSEERKLQNVCWDFFADSGTGVKKIGTELDVLPVQQFEYFTASFPDCEFKNVSPVVLEQRKQKDPDEIITMGKACDVVHVGHEAVLATLREGVTELELAAAVEDAHRRAGHEGIFFIRQPDFFMSRGPIGAGPNLGKISGVVYTITGVGLSPSVPAGPSRRKIRRGEPVIVDIPTCVDGYHADQTRTYCIGEPIRAIQSLYDSLREIADYLIEEMRPGMKGSDLYRMARAKAEHLKVTDAFLHFGRGRKSRLLGHGIGLELNEPPVPSEYDHSVINENYVIALDMHMLDDRLGVVKLEDMILIGANGNEILTKTPRQLWIV
ncbi:MAG TPA: aminopeptidase P family protein [Deltaproteobacteria bacterium]|nr:aminopeptidase P family protein [Deltaproteobacteria bacterium]